MDLMTTKKNAFRYANAEIILNYIVFNTTHIVMFVDNSTGNSRKHRLVFNSVLPQCISNKIYKKLQND